MHNSRPAGTILLMTDMVRITLVPDTSHCIETVAKMEYRELMHSCLRTGTADAYSAEKMELLHDFLEAADFKASLFIGPTSATL